MGEAITGFSTAGDASGDAKVLTGRQKPLTEVAIIIAEIRSRDGFEGVGFSYSKRAGGQVFMLTPKR